MARDEHRYNEEHREWRGDEGKPFPTCPATHTGECEPSLCLLREFRCVRCKQWRLFCCGHSEGAECAQCLEDIENRIIAYIAESKRGYRRESKILYKFCGTNDVVAGKDLENTLTHSRVEDILFELVNDDRLEWKDDLPDDHPSKHDEDIRYHVVEKKGPRIDAITGDMGRLDVPGPSTGTRSARSGKSRASKAHQ